MTPYLAVLGARFRMLLQYRAAALAGMATQLFWGLIRAMIFTAFYRAATGPQPMELAQTIDYVWLGQAAFAMLPWAIDGEIRQMIRSGAVAYELVRPVDLYTLWYFRALASRGAPTLLRATPVLAVALLCLGLRPPASAAAGAAWALAMVGALLLSGAVSNLLHVSLMWTITGEGIAQLVQVAVFLLSGLIVPLPLYPDWAQTAIAWLPFRGLADLPFRLWAGHLPPTALWSVLAQQLGWTLGLALFGRWLLGRGLRRLTVQGG
ncbi:MAG: ABC-2 family transporter protein [Candidatus Latescibacterota bacterium]